MRGRASSRRLLGGLAIAGLAAGCQVALPIPGSTAAPSLAAASGTVPPSICTSTRSPGSTDHTTGTLLGSVDQGRILFGVEGAGGTESGTFAFGIIDRSGLHTTPTTDWTMAHAIWAPGGGIIFDSERNDDRHLFRSAEDGTGVTQLTSDFRGAEQSAALIGSDRLVFTNYSCSEPRDLGLHTAAIDGSGIADLTPDHQVGDPVGDDHAAVSPDGKAVVFVRFSNDSQSIGGLFAVPVAGGTATRLTDDASGTRYPRFSPDGRSILFTRADAAGDDSLWLEPAAGGSPRQLTSFPAGTSAFLADWAPDGTEIVTTLYVHGWNYNELHILRADGTGDRVLWRGSLSTGETPDWGN